MAFKVLSKSELHEGISKDGPPHHTGTTFITRDHLGASVLCRVTESHYSPMQFASKMKRPLHERGAFNRDQTMPRPSRRCLLLFEQNPTSLRVRAMSTMKRKQRGTAGGALAQGAPPRVPVDLQKMNKRSERDRCDCNTSSVTRALRYAEHETCPLGTGQSEILKSLHRGLCRVRRLDTTPMCRRADQPRRFH